jgi:hypothetical protein
MRAFALLFVLSALFRGASSWGFCHDVNDNCHSWAKAGECNGNNAEYMRSACPLACGACHHLCRDVEEACIDWAADGQCTSNPTYMYKNCPSSCGVCKERCFDKEPLDKCGEWARAGECSKNPGLLTQCPVSCGVCTSMCLDRHSDCANWAAEGGCLNNSHYMLRECSSSCKVCDKARHSTEICDDRHIRQCHIWGAHECTVNPVVLLNDCPKLCGACELVCADKKPDCPGWAKAKEGRTACEEHGGWLSTECPYSCGLCPRMNRFPAEVKDEI